MFAQQLGLLFHCVLRCFEASDDHRVHDARDLEVGQRAVERRVVHAAEIADHVIVRVIALGSDVVVDVVLEAVETGEHLAGLFGGELVVQSGAVDERSDHGVTPLGKQRDVGERETEHAGHHALWQRPGKAADELDVGR